MDKNFGQLAFRKYKDVFLERALFSAHRNITLSRFAKRRTRHSQGAVLTSTVAKKKRNRIHAEVQNHWRFFRKSCLINMNVIIVLICFVQICQDCQCKPIIGVVRKCSLEASTESIKLMGEDKVIMGCTPCLLCPAGQEPHFPCGSVISVKYTSKIRCFLCPNGTYSSIFSRSSCKKCKKCDGGLIEIHKCTPTTDTVCGPRKSDCKQGFYLSENFGCLPCSPCCGDSEDIKINECATQGSQSRKLCSIRSYHRCFENINENATQNFETRKRFSLDSSFTTGVRNMRTTTSTPRSNISHIYWRNEEDLVIYESRFLALIISFFIVIIFLMSIISCLKIKRNRKSSEAQCFPRMRLSKSNNTSVIKICQGDQTDDLVDWSNNDISSSEYSFQCGIGIKYNPESKQDRFKKLAVESLCAQTMDSHFRNINPEQIFLSPIYRFYTPGENFENKVKISLPHSAACRPDQKTWDIEILCMDERKGKDAKWEKISDSLEVNWKDASFYTDTLLTYAVVGKPLKGAKKRMQLVLFSKSEMISDLFEVGIHLLDDNETSFQNVLKENSLKGFAMLGSFYAVFVDCFDSVDINVNIEGLLDGWELDHLKPKTISISDCQESYFSIPCFQAAFCRVKRNADKFSCKFRIDVAGNEIIIPAFTFVPEEEFCVVVDVHEQDYDASVLKEKKTLFKDQDYDTKYVLARLLDVSVKGQGTWRQLGRHFGLPEDEVEQFSVEYRTLEGSPSRALFDYLSVTQPNITVGEFVTCLEGLGREDAIALLYKHLKKKPLNTKI